MEKYNKVFWVLIGLILIFGLIIRLYPILDNRIFFTVDEGRDAVYVREILNYHRIFTKGPQSSVAGIFTGPFWYYFVSIGYAVMHGSPVGVPFMLILLNLFTTSVLIFVITKKADWKIALVIGLGLQIFWPFFMTSLWGFNPFPLAALSIFLVLILEKFLEGKRKYYSFALIPILLAFNTELAGATAFLIFYILFGIWAVWKKKLDWQSLFIFGFGLPLLGGLKILNDFANQPISLINNSGLGVFAGLNFVNMTHEFLKMVGGATIPQSPTVGFVITIIIFTSIACKAEGFGIVIWKKANKFTKNFSLLTFNLVFISYLFFSSNQGWRSWHTVYVPVLTLVATFLVCYELKRIGKALIVIILFLQFLNFTNNYFDYLKPSNNSSLLSNQMKVMDWIYTNNEGNGFNAYNYTNTFYDYPYQYLFTWYGKRKYGFLPCEYSNFPLSHKELYVPGWDHYVEPKLGCDKFRFLIIESDTNGEDNKDWIDEFRIEHHLIDKIKIGNTVIEKYTTRDIY